MSGTEPDKPDERDARVDAAWRKLADDTPPPALDDAIRAAARRAVQAKPVGGKARAPWPAWMPLAAAASIGVIAIGVWQMLPREDDPTRVAVSDVPAARGGVPAVAPATVPAAPAATPNALPAAPSAALATAQGHAPAADGMMAQAKPSAPAAPSPFPGRARDEQVATSRSVVAPKAAAGSSAGNAPAPSPGPQALAMQKSTLDAKDAGSVQARMSARAAAAPLADGNAVVAAAPPAQPPARAAAAASPAPAPPAVSVAKEAPRSFDDYIAAIHRALDAQRNDDAVKELQALRAAYPDADERMPQELRSWAFRIRK